MVKKTFVLDRVPFYMCMVHKITSKNMLELTHKLYGCTSISPHPSQIVLTCIDTMSLNSMSAFDLLKMYVLNRATQNRTIQDKT